MVLSLSSFYNTATDNNSLQISGLEKERVTLNEDKDGLHKQLTDCQNDIETKEKETEQLKHDIETKESQIKQLNQEFEQYKVRSSSYILDITGS